MTSKKIKLFMEKNMDKKCEVTTDFEKGTFTGKIEMGHRGPIFRYDDSYEDYKGLYTWWYNLKTIKLI